MRRFLLVLAFSISIVLPTIAAEPVDAVWREQVIETGFASLKVAYSCELLEARIGMLLRHVGAADDVAVSVSPCGAFDRPFRQHQIKATFSTLVPAALGDVNVVKAEWSDVELREGRPRSIDKRDCELIEQFREQFLSKIEHEVIEGSAGCNASRRSLVGRLKLRVLKPVPEDDSGSQ